MNVGDQVLINIPIENGERHSTFHGCVGRVVSLHPTMVVIGDDARPIFFGDAEMLPASDRSHHGGAE